MGPGQILVRNVNHMCVHNRENQIMTKNRKERESIITVKLLTSGDQDILRELEQ